MRSARSTSENTSLKRPSQNRTFPNLKKNFMKQITIKTQEADIPLIKIIKTSTEEQNKFLQIIQQLETLVKVVKLKNIHFGFTKILNCHHSHHIKKGQKKEAFLILFKIDNRLKAKVFLKIINKSQINQRKEMICRLIGKISFNFINKMKQAGISKMKMSQKKIKQIDDTSKTQILPNSSTFQISQPIKEIFLKLMKMNSNMFIEFSLENLKPALNNEFKEKKRIKDVKQMKISELTLKVLFNHLINFEKILSSYEQREKQREEFQNRKQELMQTIRRTESLQRQVDIADNQIKKTLKQNKVVNFLTFKRVIEKQLKAWEKKKGTSFIQSRILFLKLILIEENYPIDSSKMEEDLIQLIENSKKINKLQAFIVSLKKKSSSVHLTELAKILLDNLRINQRRISQESQREQQEPIMTYLDAIVTEINSFLRKWKMKNQKNTPIFAQLKEKSVKLNKLYRSIQQLATIIDQNEEKIEDGEKDQILLKYIQCLEKNDYSSWNSYTTKNEIKKIKGYQRTVEIINTLNDKIEILVDLQKKSLNQTYEQSHRSVIELSKARENEEKIFKKTKRDYEQKIGKLEKQNKKLLIQIQELSQVQMGETEKSEIQLSQYEQIKNTNNYLNDRIIGLTDQMGKVVEQLQKKQQLFKRSQQDLIQANSRTEINAKTFNKAYESLETQIRRLNQVIKQKEDLLLQQIQKYNQLHEQIKKNENVKSLKESLISQKNQLKESHNILESMDKGFQKEGSEEKYSELIDVIKLDEELEKMERKDQEKSQYIWKLEMMIKEKDESLGSITEQMIRMREKQSRILTPSIEEHDATVSELMEKNKAIINLQNRITHLNEDNRILKESLAGRESHYHSQILKLNNQLNNLMEERNSFRESSYLTATKYRQKIQQLENQIHLMNQEQLHDMTPLNNVVILVSNILTKYIQSSDSNEVPKVKEDLDKIWVNYNQNQEDLFIELQQFAIWFVNKDVCKYRNHLKFQIERLYELKNKMTELITNQIVESNQLLNIEYGFDEWQRTKNQFSTKQKNDSVQKIGRAEGNVTRVLFSQSEK